MRVLPQVRQVEDRARASPEEKVLGVQGASGGSFANQTWVSYWSSFLLLQGFEDYMLKKQQEVKCELFFSQPIHSNSHFSSRFITKFPSHKSVNFAINKSLICDSDSSRRAELESAIRFIKNSKDKKLIFNLLFIGLILFNNNKTKDKTKKASKTYYREVKREFSSSRAH